jgi:AAA domain
LSNVSEATPLDEDEAFERLVDAFPRSTWGDWEPEVERPSSIRPPVERCSECGINLPKSPAGGLCRGCLGEPFPGGSLVPLAHPASDHRNTSSVGDADIRFVSLAGRKAKPVRWVWSGRIPVGVGTLLAGLPGGGKTHVALHLGSMLTRGTLPGHFDGTPSGIVVMSREDMLDETIVPRLQAEGADMDRVFALPFASGSFSVETDMPELDRLVARESVRMVILDPMLAFTTGDTFKEAEVRRTLEPAQRLMEEHKLSITGVMHLNKDVMKDLLSRVTSSGAFTAIVRSVLFAGADPDDDEDERNPSKILAHGKSNLSRIAPSLGFRIVGCTVPGEDEEGYQVEVETSRLEMLGDSEVTAEQLVKGRASAGSKQQQAEALIRRLCPAHKDSIIREGVVAGISEPTLRRAYRRMGGEVVEQERDPETGKMGTVMWRLPNWHGYGS